MEDPAGIDREPPDGVVGALPAQQAHPRRVVRVPGVRQLRTGRGGVHAERHGQVEQHHVALGEREVVHHRAVVDRDVGGLADPAVGADDHVLDVVPAPEVGDRVQVAGAPVQLRVRGVPAGERAAEVAGTHGVQVLGQLVRQWAGLDGGQQPPGVGEDVRVGGEVHPGVHGTAGPRLAQRLGDLGGAHPPVAVPLGPAVAQSDPVHHAGPQEPVLQGFVEAQRIGPVAQVAAAELGWAAGRSPAGPPR